MKRLERLISDLRKQLFPFHDEHDAERSCERWEVGKGEFTALWLLEQLRNCRKKNRCDKRGRCVYYSYSDLSRRNYEICYEVILRLENGDMKCSMDGEDIGEIED